MSGARKRPRCVFCDRLASCKLVSMVSDREEHFCEGHRYVAIAAAGDPSKEWEFEQLRKRKPRRPYSPL